jgi:peptidoglycan/xylan/chitin deacetylase (PgdA/CDA1 family)
VSDASVTRRLIARWGLGPMSAAFDRATRRRLRVLGYHGVDDAVMFEAHLRFIASRYVPVSGSDVVEAIVNGNELPERAVWVTFDDGYRSVIDNAAVALNRYGITATMFVCPGLVEHHEPAWFDIALEALADPPNAAIVPGEASVAPMLRLKRLPDGQRRSVVDELAATIPADRLAKLADRIADAELLVKWRSMGHEVGNHTWDHPILPLVEDSGVERQIVRAEQWLRAHDLHSEPRLFAFPNGDTDHRIVRAVRRHGYECPVLFDHRLAKVPAADGCVSRLRVSSMASLARLDAILSGAHSALLHARTETKRVIPRAAERQDESIS